MAGSWKAVKQEELRGVGRARIAIEDPEAVHVNFSIVDGRHDVGLRVYLPSAHRSRRGLLSGSLRHGRGPHWDFCATSSCSSGRVGSVTVKSTLIWLRLPE